MSASLLIVLGGFALAFVFGVTASATNFCTMGAISDAFNMGHWGRARMWLLAVAVALAGTQLLALGGLVELDASMYGRPSLPWLSIVWGGTLFGIGMTLAGGCANKNLLRMGAGSLRSGVVLLVLAVSAYMAMKGLFAQWRVDTTDRFTLDLTTWGLASQRLPGLLSRLTGQSVQALSVALSTLALAGMLGFVFKDARFRTNRRHIVAAILLGATVPAAWYLSGHLGHGENPETLEIVYFATNSRTLESLSLVAPMAYGLELLMLWTDKSLHVSFGIASALGVFAGSLVYALVTRSFRWEGFASADDLRTQLLGAVLMGYGGVSAAGCTIGQGMSGLSTLSAGSVLAVAGMVLGAMATMKWQMRD